LSGGHEIGRKRSHDLNVLSKSQCFAGYDRRSKSLRNCIVWSVRMTLYRLGLAAMASVAMSPVSSVGSWAADASPPQAAEATVAGPSKAPSAPFGVVPPSLPTRPVIIAPVARPTPETTAEAPAVVAPIASSPAGATTAARDGTPLVAAAPPPVRPKPVTTLLIDIDLTRQTMTVTENGKTFGSWPISSGRSGFRSPTGTFRPLWASKMWYSKKYDNAPMPHAVFFSGGVAMHATQATGMLGQPASHGCIRQSPSNAATTYRLVAKHGHAATKIVVHGTPSDREPRIAARERSSAPVQLAARDARRSTGGAVASAPVSPRAGLRRVILVDGDGNRRVTDIPANDPRLIAYQHRVMPMASSARPYYAARTFGAAW